MRLLLDLDEVLADFTGAALAAHGWTRDDLESRRVPGQWDLTIAMGITEDEFWAPIDAEGIDFWLDLKPLPWMDQMLDICLSRQYGWEGVHVVSTPSRSPWSDVGKAVWIQQYLQCHIDTYHLSADKSKFAALGDAVLIDDRVSTVQRFRRAGGEAILFPSNGNFLWDDAADPVPYVEDQLKHLTKPIGDYYALDI